MVSDEGIKAFLTKKVIGILNTKINFFIKKLDGNAVVSFDETFEETITNERGVKCSYHNFSGAERKAIDLAMLFAFQDIRKVQSSVWFNIVIFDELLDSSVDEKGIEAILNIIKERLEKYKECVYIVSHRRESVKYCTSGEVVYLEKKNGETTRDEHFKPT